MPVCQRPVAQRGQRQSGRLHGDDEAGRHVPLAESLQRRPPVTRHEVEHIGDLLPPEHYELDARTETIDFNSVRAKARELKPKMILCGYGAYPRTIDFAQFRQICDEVSALLMADIAHIAGLVAAGVHPSPFPHAASSRRRLTRRFAARAAG